MRYLFTAVLTPNDVGGYEVRIPDIDHCVTSGRDLPDALDMIIDAASLMLVCMEDDKTTIPQPTPHHQVPVPAGSISTLVSLDTDSYRIMNHTRAVRKNVSLPEWMVMLADQRGINCSQVLQDALRQMLFKTIQHK